VRNGGGTKLDINAAVTRKKGTKEKPPQAIVNFEIPDQYLLGDNKNSQVLVVCYLDIGEESETIGSFGVTDRNHTYHSNVRIHTLANLKSGDAWKK